MKYLNSIILTAFVGAYGYAQTPVEVYQDFHNDEDVILIEQSETMTIDMVDGVPVVSVVNTENMVINNYENAYYLSDDQVSFSSFEKIDYIDAIAYNPKGSRFKKSKAENFYTQDSGPEGNIFHDDTKTTSFDFYGLADGSQRYIEYKKIYKDNKFPTLFVFPSYYSCMNSTFKIDADTAVHMFFKLNGATKDLIEYTHEEVDGRNIYTWTIKNQDGVRLEDGSPSVTYFGNHIIAQIGYYYDAEGKKVRGVNDVSDLHEWYKDNVKEVENEEASEEIAAIVDSLISENDTELEKVKKIYYWVQSNIKYIAFEDGMGGFVPRPAELVCSRKFGDCKDMSALCYVMLKHAGVKSYLTWIGSRDIPYKYTEIPSLVTDNHMICIYKDSADKHYILDATSSFQPIDLPTSFIQGKQAMMHLGQEEGFEIYEVPVIPAESSLLLDSTFIEIDGKNIKGQTKREYSGYYNIFFNYLTDAKSKDEVEGRLEKYCEKGNNSFNVFDAVLENRKDRDHNLITNFDFLVNNYVTSFEDEIYISLILEKDVIPPLLKEDRKLPFELDDKVTDQYTVALKIPDGYTVSYLPENQNFDNGALAFSVEYTQVGDILFCTLKLKTNTLLLEAEETSKWNEYIKSLKKIINENVVLKKA